MPKYDEFDLDVQNLTGEENGAEQRGITTFITGIVAGSVLTGCSSDCVTANCSKGCSASCGKSVCNIC